MKQTIRMRREGGTVVLVLRRKSEDYPALGSVSTQITLVFDPATLCTLTKEMQILASRKVGAFEMDL